MFAGKVYALMALICIAQCAQIREQLDRSVEVDAPESNFTVRNGTRNFQFTLRVTATYYNLTANDRYAIESFIDYPNNCYAQRSYTATSTPAKDYRADLDVICSIDDEIYTTKNYQITTYAWINPRNETKITAKDVQKVTIKVR